ncbi:hypothetical protein FACS1894187_19850 [Synergistales bacterium]|nr:hypothetical protein FACS1894187_19850 [Synergistales bacterium]
MSPPAEPGVYQFNYPNGARFGIYTQWKKGRSAHVYVAEIENGKVVFYDPQNPSSNAEDYLKLGKNFKYWRMDNAKFDPNLDISALIKEGKKP